MDRALSVYLTFACVPIGLEGHGDPISEFEAIIVSGKKTVNLRLWILVHYQPNVKLACMTSQVAPRLQA